MRKSWVHVSKITQTSVNSVKLAKITTLTSFGKFGLRKILMLKFGLPGKSLKTPGLHPYHSTWYKHTLHPHHSTNLLLTKYHTFWHTALLHSHFAFHNPTTWHSLQRYVSDFLSFTQLQPRWCFHVFILQHQREESPWEVLSNLSRHQYQAVTGVQLMGYSIVQHGGWLAGWGLDSWKRIIWYRCEKCVQFGCIFIFIWLHHYLDVTHPQYSYGPWCCIYLNQQHI